MSTSPTVGPLTERLIRRFRFPESLGTTCWFIQFFSYFPSSGGPAFWLSFTLILDGYIPTLAQFKFSPYGHFQYTTKPLSLLSRRRRAKRPLDFRPSIGDFSPGGLKKGMMTETLLTIPQHHN